MERHDWLAQEFEYNRTHLQAVAFRILGSLSEADDAVQEAWPHASRADTSAVENMGGWLTTIVARVCLDMLRARKARREEPLDADRSEPVATRTHAGDPEDEAMLADSVGLALLVVLETLPPAERLAFVLHDIFAVSFEEIAPIVGRSSEATRQLASRARRRVQGTASGTVADLSRQREVVDAFLAASRKGDLPALIAVLDTDVVLRADSTAEPQEALRVIHGAAAVAKQFAGRAQAARIALVNGRVGVVVAPRGRLRLVVRLAIASGKIVAMDAIADPAQVSQLELAVLDE